MAKVADAAKAAPDASRARRIYLSPGLRLVVWADGTDLPVAESADATDATMRALMSAITLPEVTDTLAASGIGNLAPASVEALRTDLCKLRAEPVEQQLSASVAHLARHLAGNNSAAMALLENMVRVGEEMKLRGDADGLAAIEPFTRALLAFHAGAQGLMVTLPPPPPRQSAPWHSDACWLANRLLTYAAEAGADVGISRATSTGVRFVAAGLRLALGFVFDPAAVAKALQRNRDN